MTLEFALGINTRRRRLGQLKFEQPFQPFLFPLPPAPAPPLSLSLSPLCLLLSFRRTTRQVLPGKRNETIGERASQRGEK